MKMPPITHTAVRHNAASAGVNGVPVYRTTISAVSNAKSRTTTARKGINDTSTDCVGCCTAGSGAAAEGTSMSTGSETGLIFGGS